MCFKICQFLFIYLFIVVIICWDLNIVIMEYTCSPIVQSFTYLSVCCSWRRLIAMDTFLFVNRLYK